ncbi:alpha/beta hydrolase [Nocardia spumae]|uniref:alpha/beta hydrolase n=1 Tax=Nocardia spumae TaxID=2887190 RepID=UPI001D142826|nr:alpha/beta hydrolase family protein [Nocardia spumae]
MSRRTGYWAALCAAVTTVAAAVTLSSGPAAAVNSDGSRIDRIVDTDARHATLTVYSAAMNRTVTLRVLRPAHPSGPSPVLYLLDGAEDGIGPGGAETSWGTRTDIDAFTADRDVTVVNILDGRYTYYTDWQADDPVLGRNKWTTFLTRELPPLVDAALHASGRNAIAGVSMSATSVLALAESAPGLYAAVGSFSGCAQTGSDPGRRFVQAVVASGGGNPWNMWGPDGAPGWAAADPTAAVNLEKLRGTELYVTAGAPAAGAEPAAPAVDDPAGGGMLESVVAQCTRRLQDATERAGIPATYRYTPGGLHAWPYWQRSLHDAWPDFERALAG